MKKYFLLSLLFGFAVNVYSQNLISNGDFENYKKKKKQTIRINDLKDCYNPSKATPDILSPYTRNTWWTSPKNAYGFQFPHSGETYLGLTIYTGDKYFSYDNNNEYITMKLNKALTKDSLYCISMYVSLADTCFYASENIGVYLSPNVPYSDYQGSGPLIINVDLQFNQPVTQYPVNYNISKEIVIDKNNWTLICDTIRSVGGENFITIGNLKKSSETKYEIVSKVKQTATLENDRNTAYYYIDDVSFLKIKDLNECKCQEELNADTSKIENVLTDFIIKKDSSFILNNINFETDQSELLASSYIELGKLYKMMVDNPQISIEISGHTDNIGLEQHNQQLSEARAKAVVDYLVLKGISKDRLTFKGLGSTKPISDNSTEEDRAKNRRVEFKIISDNK